LAKTPLQNGRRARVHSGVLRTALAAAPLVVLAGCSVKPEPLSDVQIASFATASLRDVTAGQERISRPIDLYEAMARALKYNLDAKVKVMEQTLRLKQVEQASSRMLPSLVADSGYAGRSNFAGSNSRLLSNKGLFQDNNDLGTINVNSSTSQERNIVTGDLTFSWHILDFGLSYVRARQAGDEALIAEHLKRKVVHRVIEDVRAVYWRALSYQQLIGQLRRVEKRVQQALENTRRIYDTQETSAITVLSYERELVQISRELGVLEGDLKTAKAQLAGLMNLAPGTSFTLAVTKRDRNMRLLRLKPRQMIATALQQRPELREAQYKLRINEKEAEAALLEMLPGINIYAGASANSNEYLFNQNWLSWGAAASWNLLNVFRYPARKAVVEGEQELLQQRALALTMSVMTQVHVGRMRYEHAIKEVRAAAEYLDVQRRLLQQMQSEAEADRLSEQTIIREEMNLVVARARHDIARADLESAYAAIIVSLGIDPYQYDDGEEGLSLRQLSRALQQAWTARGDPLKEAAG
jgi:outer membrane protein TolC